MTNPYQSLEERAFWAPAVGRRDALDIADLWVPKGPIVPHHRIATFGSCFAQHFGRALAARGYHWLDAEPAPATLSPDNAKNFNYGIFSARTANIYTVSLLCQWIDWALGTPSPQDEVWEKAGRFYDPFRPNIEPGGFASAEEMLASREMAIEAFGRAIRGSDVFVFTLGLTESWWNREKGYEYPMCPGTVAGTFDADLHEFRNQTYPFIEKRLRHALVQLRQANPKIRVLLTVSPVPLTATKSGDHVLVATTYSKSTLRAVAGDAAARFQYVDYFPSYEIITAPAFGGRFFAENKRSVLSEGVDHVMANFFACMRAAFPRAMRNVGEPVGDAVAAVADKPADLVRAKEARRARRAAMAAAESGQTADETADQATDQMGDQPAKARPDAVARAERRARRAGAQGTAAGAAEEVIQSTPAAAAADDLVCEEEFLAAFGEGRTPS